MQTTYFTSYKAFSKIKQRSGISTPASFSALFSKKNIYLVIFYYLTKFHFLVTFTSRGIWKYVYCNCLLIGCDALNFEINLFWNQIFPIKPTLPKSQDKNLNLLRTKRALRWNKEHFASFLTLSWRRPLSYRNQSIDLQSKSMDWFLCVNDLRHERVKGFSSKEENKPIFLEGEIPTLRLKNDKTSTKYGVLIKWQENTCNEVFLLVKVKALGTQFY